jgi:probable HAF family extracellular repeat protein
VNTKRLTCTIAFSLISATAITMPMFAQNGTEPRSIHHRYKFVDLGTLGGTSSFIGFNIVSVNNSGVTTGQADTPTSNPFYPQELPILLDDPQIYHAFRWRDGIVTDLGALVAGQDSAGISINEKGDIAGFSKNATIDPYTGLPEIRAVLWKDGNILDLGTLGGNESFTNSVNNRGQVAGFAQNSVKDPLNLFGLGTQSRAFLWDEGKMQDLGTLGGTDSWGAYVNDRGQVAGFSYTDTMTNPDTGLPTLHPFIWENGEMKDLGTLGGTQVYAVNGLNNHGQVVGIMTLAGEKVSHGYFWNGKKLVDLGTFGGDTSQAEWLNDAGEVVGQADYSTPCPGCVSPTIHKAFLWKNGVMTDLGTVDKCSAAYGINSQTQIVGASGLCGIPVHAFLWEHGSIVDLNTLIPPDSGLQLVYGLYINDRGSIVGLGVPPGIPVENVESQGHAFLLIPCDRDDAACDR